MSKVLIVDKSIDRKKRIAALKERGFSVFPALQLAEARSRCKPGAYDLVIVNTQDEPEMAAAFCEELSGRTPPQAVLMAVSNVSGANGRDFVVADDPEILAQRVSALLSHSPQAREESEQEKQDRPPARISA
jgi:DNA-binding response OmpR family regulator